MAHDGEHEFDQDKHVVAFVSRILTRAGWVLAVGSFLVGAITMLTSGRDKEGYDLGNLDPQLFDGLLILLIGSLSGLFLVMISGFVRAHLNSQTVLELEISHLVSVIRPQSESPDPDDARE